VVPFLQFHVKFNVPCKIDNVIDNVKIDNIDTIDDTIAIIFPRYSIFEKVRTRLAIARIYFFLVHH